MIIKNIKRLSKPCDIVSIPEGEEIGVRLLHEIRQSKIGIGLAANQIGINKRVCIVNVKEPLVLINPEIIESTGEFIFRESCLSYPKKVVPVKRYTMIAVEAEGLDEPLVFDITGPSNREDILEKARERYKRKKLEKMKRKQREELYGE